MPESVERARVLFHGTVQGVGFRYTAQRLAAAHPDVTGRVRNLPDGSVELIAEGSRADVEALVADINSRMTGYISTTDIQTSRGPRLHSLFRIGY